MYKGYLHEDAVAGALVEILATRAESDVQAFPEAAKRVDARNTLNSAGSMFSFRWLKFEVVIVVHPRGARSR